MFPIKRFCNISSSRWFTYGPRGALKFISPHANAFYSNSPHDKNDGDGVDGATTISENIVANNFSSNKPKRRSTPVMMLVTESMNAFPKHHKVGSLVQDNDTITDSTPLTKGRIMMRSNKLKDSEFIFDGSISSDISEGGNMRSISQNRRSLSMKKRRSNMNKNLPYFAKDMSKEVQESIHSLPEVDYHGIKPWEPTEYDDNLVLDDLLTMPKLNLGSFSAQQQIDLLKDLPWPVSDEDVEQSLAYEFGRRILVTKTDITKYPFWDLKDKQGMSIYPIELKRAADLAIQVLVARGNRGTVVDKTGLVSTLKRPRKQPALDKTIQEECDKTETWLRQECAQLWYELQTGDRSRHENLIPMIDEQGQPIEYSEEQLAVLKPTEKELAKNERVHPEIKKEIMGHISSVVRDALKAKSTGVIIKSELT